MGLGDSPSSNPNGRLTVTNGGPIESHSWGSPLNGSHERQQFELLTNRSPDIIVGTDRKGRVIYFNDGAHDNTWL